MREIVRLDRRAAVVPQVRPLSWHALRPPARPSMAPALAAVVALTPLLSSSCTVGPTVQRVGNEGLEANQARVYLDTWGIPHIYAETAEAGLYASGWLQAEDRLEQVLKNYLLGMGEYAAAHGAGEGDRWVRSDFESRVWDHYGTSKRLYEEKLNPELRSHLAAFVAGINDFMAQHPQDVPSWWGGRPVDVYMPVAFSRQFIWGWPAGQARNDLRKVGLEPNYDVDARASNEIALAPERTTFGAAALIIDPHLAWLGRQRYWEVRLHAGDIHISGFATAGFPYVNLGHNENVAWAHTTGGPDTADVYRLELDEAGTRYRFDGEWRNLEAQSFEIAVAGEKPRAFETQRSHHGPIVARDGNTAYAAALAYEHEIGYLESKYWFMVAEDYQGAQRALEVRQIMPQNVMVADTGGNIYYQRTGRVPIRPDGYDWSAPVDGTTSATAWQGIHESSDLMSLLNPPQGYMQNCNIGPDTMLVGSPLVPESTKPYLYNQPKWSTHQRGASAIERLETTDTWSEADLLELSVDRGVLQAERWILPLVAAAAGAELETEERDFVTRLAGWNFRSDADSNGALLYSLWRTQLRDALGNEEMATLEARVNNYLARFPGASEGVSGPTVADLVHFVDAVRAATAAALDRWGHLDAVFGDVYRVGRLDASDDVSWPVGGGSLTRIGMATLRSVGFEEPRADGTRWGSRGQTSTQVVFLTDPIRSFSQPPIGQSDRPESLHYRDQAEKLFSTGKLKPAWFALEELLDGNVASEQTLTYDGLEPDAR